MDIRYTLIMAMCLAALISYLSTPLVRKLAIKLNAIDIPKDERRVHKIPIPRMGGLAIFLGIIVSYWVFSSADISKKVVISACTICMLVTGIGDDIKPISAKMKLLFQIAAALLLCAGGIKIEFFTNIFSDSREIVSLGWFALPITVFWVVGITNTVNLIDGLDGLAAGISGIGAITLALVAIQFGGHDAVLVAHMNNVAILSIVIAGACIGFLPHNFNPARIFMGDTGSLMLGFLLAVASIDGALKGTAVLTFAVPMLALGLPIFDTTFAIIRRVLSGQSITEADRGHLHHRFLQVGMNQKRAVISLYMIAILMGSSSLFLASDKFIHAFIVLVLSLALIMIPLGRVDDSKQKEG